MRLRKSVSGSLDSFPAVVIIKNSCHYLSRPYSIDIRTVDIGACDISFRGGVTNPSVRISLSKIYIQITGRYKKKVL